MNQKKLEEEEILISVEFLVVEGEGRISVLLQYSLTSSTWNLGRSLTKQIALDKEPCIKGKALSSHSTRVPREPWGVGDVCFSL